MLRIAHLQELVVFRGTHTHDAMSDAAGTRKRMAEKQGSRDDDRDAEEFVTTPQEAAPEVLAMRRIVSVRKPAGTTAGATGAAPPAGASPFGSVLGAFGSATASVAPSPFAAFGGSAAKPAGSPAAAGGFGSGFNFGIAPKAPEAAPSASTPAASAPAPSSGVTFSFGTSVAPGAPAAKFDFGAAVSAFSAAAANAKQQTPQTSTDENDEDPEAEVPIAAGAPTLPAAETKTGEEGDNVLFESPNAKLLEYCAAEGDEPDKKSWHERGAGTIKVSTKGDGSFSRVVMRDAKIKKVLLNCALQKSSFRIGQKQEKMFSFTAPNDGIVSTYLVKIAGAKAAEEVKAILSVAEQILA